MNVKTAFIISISYPNLYPSNHASEFLSNMKHIIGGANIATSGIYLSFTDFFVNMPKQTGLR